VITCHFSFLEHRCRERGYTLDEVMPCVVAQDGDQWTIDTEHRVYPGRPKPGFDPPVPPEFASEPPSGCLAGTALKSLLASFGITATPDCPCTARAAEMDRRGCDWCEENIDTIVGWLREQAEARGLPFLDAAGRILVRRAIRNARRAAAS